MATKDEIREKLLLALPYFRNAMKKATAEAPPGSTIGVGILHYTRSGSGKIVAKFEAPEFFEDIAMLIDAPAYTEADDAMANEQAKADELLQKLGL